MDPSSIAGFLALAVSTIHLLLKIASDAGKEEREAADKFTRIAYEFCVNVAGWYTRVTDLTNSVLTSGRAGTLDKAKINESKEKIFKIMHDDVYWTRTHVSLTNLKRSLEYLSHISAKEGIRKVDEILSAFNSFKEHVLAHKTKIYELLASWDEMGTRVRIEELNELEVEKVTIERHKDDLVSLIKGIELFLK